MKKWVVTSYVAGNERRNKFLRRWMKLGLPLPDPKTGRTGILAKAVQLRGKRVGDGMNCRAVDSACGGDDCD